MLEVEHVAAVADHAAAHDKLVHKTLAERRVKCFYPWVCVGVLSAGWVLANTSSPLFHLLSFPRSSFLSLSLE